MRRALSRCAALVAIAVTSSLAAACARDGTPFECTCEWLTDYDDRESVQTRVCATSEDEARAMGPGCAQTGIPAPVQRCTCARSKDAPSPCRVGCRSAEGHD
ncbi:MAG: hypothetical protein U0441_37240 [Polyangiaceae bacterium]